MAYNILIGALGFTFSSSWASCNELGQKFTGSISGWMNLCGNLGGVVAPTLTAIIAVRYGWQWAISATALIGVLGVCAWFLVCPEQPLTMTNTPKSRVASARPWNFAGFFDTLGLVLIEN